jgi:hypothetical protein
VKALPLGKVTVKTAVFMPVSGIGVVPPPPVVVVAEILILSIGAFAHQLQQQKR